MGLFSKSIPATATPEAPKTPAGESAAPAPAAAPAPKPRIAAAQSGDGARPEPAPTLGTTGTVASPAERTPYFQQLKVRIHQQLVERLDVQNLKMLPPDVVRREVRVLIRELCQQEKGLLTSADQERLMDEVMDETFGLGPLETLLKDPLISDILINRFDRVYVERRGRLEPVDVHFRGDNHLRQIRDCIVGQGGRRIDEICPMVDARLPDGSRVNAIIPPLAVDGSAMSIRRF